MPPLLFYFIIQETRIKFPENPEKFMESEMELHDALQVLIYLSIYGGKGDGWGGYRYFSQLRASLY